MERKPSALRRQAYDAAMTPWHVARASIRREKKTELIYAQVSGVEECTAAAIVFVLDVEVRSGA